ncbi:MAG TPA: YncE family protein, partial [Terriglobales bacterium]|nr:YncE family protein [Terriglobales bacterium]
MTLASHLGMLITLSVLLAPASLTAQPVLSTGDSVSGFGVVGSGGFTLKGIGDDGRALVHGILSDGTQGLYWAADRQLTHLWTPPHGVQVELGSAVLTGNGTAVIPAFIGGRPDHFYYVVPAGGDVRTVVPPDRDAGGNTICQFDWHKVWVNRAGQLAFDAFLAPAGSECGSGSAPTPEAIFVDDGSQWSTRLHSADLPGFSNSLRIAGFTGDGEIIASFVSSDAVGDGMRIVAAGASGVRVLLSAGDVTPDGNSIESIDDLRVADNGDIAFTAYAGGVQGVYAIRSGTLQSLGGSDGARLADVSNSGTVLMLVSDQAVFAIDADGSRRVLFRGGRNTGFGYYSALVGDAEINAAGDIVFTIWSVDGDAGHRIARVVANGHESEVVLASGDPGPGGTVVATGGFSGSSSICLGAAGQLGLVVPSVSGHSGLICIDGDGPHLIMQSGDPAPNGDFFRGFGDCSFSDDGALTFAAHRAVPWERSQTPHVQFSIYRASDHGIETLVADFDPIANGEELVDHGSGLDFVTNRQGKVLLRGGEGLVLYEGAVLAPFLFGENVREYAIADDGTVVVIAQTRSWWSGHNGLAEQDVLLEVINGFILRRLTAADLMIPANGWDGNLNNLRVRGDRVFVDVGQWTAERILTYRLGESEVARISSVEARNVVAVRRDGAVVESISRPSQPAYRIVTLDGRASAPFPGEVLASNDRGDLAVLHTDADWAHHSLELVRSSADSVARCPQVGSAPPPTPPVGTPTPAPIASNGDHRVYVVERGNDTLTAIDGVTHQRLASVVVSHGPFALAVSPDGNRIFVLAESRVDVLEAGSLQRLASLPIGETGTNIFAAGDNLRAYVSVTASKVGNGRFLAIDADRGLVSSVLLPERATVFGVTARDTLLATALSGSQTSTCSATNSLLEIDPADGQVLHRTAIGTQSSAAVMGADGTAYVADSCNNSLSVIDPQTLATTSTSLSRSPFGLAVSGDGQRAAISQSYSSWPPEMQQELGYVSQVDLATGTSIDFEVPIGMARALDYSPSGDVLYVTGNGAFVAVLDAADGDLLARVPVSGRANDVAVGRVPTAIPTPPVEDTAAIVQVDSRTGANGDEAPIIVRFDSNGQPIHRLTFELITTWGVSLVGSGGNTECDLDPAIAADATFEHADFCGYYCDRTSVSITMKDAGTTLPSAAPLITCWSRPSTFGQSPLLITKATATDSAGNPLPIRSGDGAIRLLAQYQVTPPPPRPPTPVATTTPPAPTATALPPVMIEAGSATIAAGERGQIQVRLRSGGAIVEGIQNDIAIGADIAIATRANGRPACFVNPEIERPDTRAAFLPDGCDARAGECSAVRILVVAFEQVPPILDGSVLYNCDVAVAAEAAEGSFALALDNVVV